MRHYRPCPSLAIIALGSVLSSAALSQEEFVGSQLMACTIDIPTHCSSAQPGGGRIVKCLQEKRAELTSECRTAVTPTDFADGKDGLTVEVRVDKLKSRQGVVIVMLSDDAERFPGPAKRTVITAIGDHDVAAVFRHLKAGTYAVTVLHDLNEDGKFGAGEGFGASKDAVGPPSFAASAIQIEASSSIAISMRYP
jgi:uncharacterized protein (DUF2141 family)